MTNIASTAGIRSPAKHSTMVRISHWLVVAAVLALTISGANILASHPRFYWGETGNVNQKPWLVIPIPSSRDTVPTAYNFVLPDENGWSRYLHFEAAWILVSTGLAYMLWALITGHVMRKFIPVRGERNWRVFIKILAKYFRYFVRGEALGAVDETRYNSLQQAAYLFVIFLLFPAIIATGLAMSSYFAAACPALVDFIGGRQNARSFHFLFVAALLGFVVGHVILVKISGFWKLVRAMTIGHR